jgi:hypothetical protein
MSQNSDKQVKRHTKPSSSFVQRRNWGIYMRSEVLVIVLMNIQVSWDMAACRLVNTDVSEKFAVSVSHRHGAISQNT